MPAWVTALFSAVMSLIKAPLSSLGAYLAGRRQGRADQRSEQLEQDLKTALDASDARRNGERGVRKDDPYNRDND